MDPTDLLLVGAEVSVAFAGFAGIIATFQFRDGTNIKRGDIVGLTMIVHISLMCALFCIFPLLLSNFEVEDRTIWTISSGIAAFWISFYGFSIARKMRGAVRKASLRIFFRLLEGVAALLVLSIILNAADIAFHREVGPYLAAIVFGLTLVGYMFGRLLLRPLWKAVHAQEAENLSGTIPS